MPISLYLTTRDEMPPLLGKKVRTMAGPRMRRLQRPEWTLTCLTPEPFASVHTSPIFRIPLYMQVGPINHRQHTVAGPATTVAQ